MACLNYWRAGAANKNFAQAGHLTVSRDQWSYHRISVRNSGKTKSKLIIVTPNSYEKKIGFSGTQYKFEAESEGWSMGSLIADEIYCKSLPVA